jgi:hypothetical protein
LEIGKVASQEKRGMFDAVLGNFACNLGF